LKKGKYKNGNYFNNKFKYNNFNFNIYYIIRGNMNLQNIKDNINKLTLNELIIISNEIEEAFNNENTLRYNENRKNLT